MTVELYQELLYVELYTVLVDPVEDSDFALPNAARVCTVRLRPLPVRLVPVYSFCVD